MCCSAKCVKRECASTYPVYIRAYLAKLDEKVTWVADYLLRGLFLDLCAVGGVNILWWMGVPCNTNHGHFANHTPNHTPNHNPQQHIKHPNQYTPTKPTFLFIPNPAPFPKLAKGFLDPPPGRNVSGLSTNSLSAMMNYCATRMAVLGLVATRWHTQIEYCAALCTLGVQSQTQ